MFISYSIKFRTLRRKVIIFYHFDKALMCILKITITLENHFSEEIMFEKKNIKG